MNSPKKLGAYRANAVRAASPGHLVVMLYDGAIRFMANAIRAFDYEDPLDFNLNVHTNITKTQAIIRELHHALDLNDGNELGQNLASLYNYFDHRLQEANITKDRAMIEEVNARNCVMRGRIPEESGQSIEYNPQDSEMAAPASPQRDLTAWIINQAKPMTKPTTTLLEE